MKPGPSSASRSARPACMLVMAALLSCPGPALAQAPAPVVAPVVGAAQTVRTAHLTVQAAPNVDAVSPGRPFSLAIEVTPRRGMHVYAPGKHTYQVVAFTVDNRPWLTAAALKYPPSELYHFVPLDERVETYQKAFTLVQDLTIPATPDAHKLLAGQKTVTVSGQLEYQACDDNICYRPTKVPLSFTMALTPRP